MAASSQDQRKGDTGAGRSRRRELFKEEDVKLQWSTVRRAVSIQPSLHSISSADRHFSTSRSLSCLWRYTCYQDEGLHRISVWRLLWQPFSGILSTRGLFWWEVHFITALMGQNSRVLE